MFRHTSSSLSTTAGASCRRDSRGGLLREMNPVGVPSFVVLGLGGRPCSSFLTSTLLSMACCLWPWPSSSWSSFSVKWGIRGQIRIPDWDLEGPVVGCTDLAPHANYHIYPISRQWRKLSPALWLGRLWLMIEILHDFVYQKFTQTQGIVVV